MAALQEKLASTEERASLGRYSSARHTHQVLELRRAISGLKKDLKKARSKYKSVVEFNDQLKQNLAVAREHFAVLRRDLVIARERVGLLELRDEAHAEDQLVIDELREELASLSFVIFEKDKRIRCQKNSIGQDSAEASEEIVPSTLSKNLGICPLARAASI